MASVNKVIIVGNLGRDPETRYMPSGDAMTNIAVATTDKWKDKASGEQKEVFSVLSGTTLIHFELSCETL